MKLNNLPFWQEYLIILGIDTAVVFLASLIFSRGLGQVSNFYFFSTLVLLVIAIIPVFSDFGSSGKVLREMQKKGVKVTEEDKQSLNEKLGGNRRGSRVTFVFGLSAVTAFVLSILTSGLGG